MLEIRKLALSFVFFFPITPTAVATQDKPPDFDPVAICQKQAEAVGQGNWLVKACLDQEQNAYNFLKAAWPSLDKKTKHLCTRQARTVSQGYWLVQACVQQELEARKQVEQFQFQR